MSGAETRRFEAIDVIRAAASDWRMSREIAAIQAKVAARAVMDSFNQLGDAYRVGYEPQRSSEAARDA